MTTLAGSHASEIPGIQKKGALPGGGRAVKMRLFISGLLVGLLLIILLQADGQPDQPARVSLVALLAAPEKFDGKLVYVTGYLRLDEEGDTLYLSETDYLHALLRNGVWVERTKEMERDIENLDSKYVSIAGYFSAKDRGHMSRSSGGIVRIRSCTFWSDPKYPIVRKLQDERKKVPK